MRIEKIHIKGFRNFEDEEIFFQPKTLIIGANDVGKTNLLYALRILFDKSISEHDLDLKDSDYNAYCNTDTVEITATICDVTEGLEFNVVFHMDMYKYIISDELGDAEEKKQSLNLHYVGITRAIDVCYIMNGTRRYRAKYGDFYDAKPSSFLFMPGLSERRNDVRWD